MLSLEEADALLASLGADASPAALLPLHVLPDASVASVDHLGGPIGSAALPVTPKKRKKQSATRQRERAELQALRLLSSDLSDRLDALRAATLLPRPLESRQLVWRYLARRRLADRRRSEQENTRLRQQVAEQAAVVSSWRDRLLQEASEQEELAYALDDADRAALDALVAGLDPAYALVDVVFCGDAASRLARQRPGKPRGQVWDAQCSSLGGGEAVELRDERVLPFAFNLVVDAVWESWRMWHVGGSSSMSGTWSSFHQYAAIDRPKDSFALKFRLACAGPDRSTVFLDEKLAVRRYVDTPDRLVMVWRGSSEGERDLFGYGTDETGWVVVERVPSPPSDEAKDRSGHALMRSYVRMVPTGVGVCSPAEWGRLTDVVIKSYEEDVGFIYREMETMLLRASRGQEER